MVDPKAVDTTLKQVEKELPALAKAVACVRPFMKLFRDSRRVGVSKQRMCFHVSSVVPSPDLDKSVRQWVATVYPDKVVVTGFEDQGWALISQMPDKRKNLSLSEFSAFLEGLNGQKKSRAKTIKKRGTAGSRQKKAVKKSTPKTKKRVPRRNGSDRR